MNVKQAAALRALDAVEDEAKRARFGKKLPKGKRAKLLLELLFGDKTQDDDSDDDE